MAKNDFGSDFARQPYSLEAEQAVLGSIIIDPKCLDNIAEWMKPELFYLPQHQDIYSAISTMFEFNQVIDFVSLLEKLKSNGTYDDDGGKAYLTQLVQSVSSSANVMEYVSIIRDKYYSRALLNAAKEIIKDVDENILDSGKLINNAEQRIYDIRSGREVSGLTHIKQVLENETYDLLAKKSDPETKNDYIGIPSGISSLDKMITGLNKSDLIILGARPGMGKTAFALNIARNVAVNAGKTVCFFSLEMTRDQLAQRLLSSEAGIKSEKLRTAELDGDEWTVLAQAGENLSKADFYIDETSSITVPEMKAKLRRMKKVDLVIVDYLGLMHTPRQNDNRVQEVAEITRSLKIMAKELKVPVIACAQLSRATEAKGKSHKPALADLRDSGSIEQDADIVLFLYREGYYDNEKKEDDDRSDPTKAECIIAKNRHGGLGSVDLYWDAEHTRFTGIDRTR
ncbi:MAG: replicative DNA helicase [Clostridia bacterium]|nr:replicative DNA helicase [Clostridia bacterium]